MSKERHKILQMLAEGKVTVEQAEKLLAAIGAAEEAKENEAPEPEPTSNHVPKYLRVVVDGHKRSHGHGDQNGDGKVNIKIPLGLIKAGVKIGSIMPGKAKNKVNSALHDHGINLDLNNLDSDTVDELLQALKTTSIDVEDGEEKVKIYCE